MIKRIKISPYKRMKNTLRCLCLIFFLIIFSLGYCGAFRNLTTNNESAPIDNIKQSSNEENKNHTSLVTYKSSRKEDNSKAINKDHNSTLIENPDITDSNILNKNSSVESQNDHENSLKLAQGNFNNRIKSLTSKISCPQKDEISNTFEYFYIFEASPYIQYIYYHRNNAAIPLFCSITIESHQRDLISNLDRLLYDFRFEYLENYGNEIICDETPGQESCRKIKNVKFYSVYHIDNIKNQINKLKNMNDCILRMINEILAIINNHDMLVNKCHFQERQNESIKIMKSILSSMIELVKKIDLQVSSNFTEIKDTCTFDNEKCISTEFNKKFREYLTKFTQKANDMVSLEFLEDPTTKNENERYETSAALQYQISLLLLKLLSISYYLLLF